MEVSVVWVPLELELGLPTDPVEVDEGVEDCELPDDDAVDVAVD